MQGDFARNELAGTRFSELNWVTTTGSTNADLLELAGQGASDGTVLVADHQSAGHGRLGRPWQAPPGSSLLVSVLVRQQMPVESLQLVSLAAGLAAVEACRSVAGVRPGLKWPNDLVVEAADGADRKVAGILAESVVQGGAVTALVVGMGLNVNWPPDLPPDLAGTATSLNHLVGHEVDREQLLVAYLRALESDLAILDAGRGAPVILRRYLEISATVGRDVKVEFASGGLTGRALGVGPHGHLIIEVGGEEVYVSAGDVVHVRPVGSLA